MAATASVPRNPRPRRPSPSSPITLRPRRLCGAREIPGPPGFDGTTGVLVPCTIVDELTRVMDVDGDVAIEVGEDCVRLAVGAVMLTSRQVDAPSCYMF